MRVASIAIAFQMTFYVIQTVHPLRRLKNSRFLHRHVSNVNATCQHVWPLGES